MKRPRALDQSTLRITPTPKPAADDPMALVVATFAAGLFSCGLAVFLWTSDAALSLPTLIMIAAVPGGAILVGKHGHWMGTKYVIAIIAIALNSLALAAGIPLLLGALLRAVFHT